MYLLANYPKISFGDNGQEVELSYQGVYSQMAAPKRGVRWMGYNGFVTSSSLVPIDGTNPRLGLLNVKLGKPQGASGSGSGATPTKDIPIVPTDINPEQSQSQNISETSTMPPEKTPDVIEVDWAHVQRPIRTHPDFQGWTAGNDTNVKNWDKETIIAAREEYKWVDNSSPSGPVEHQLTAMEIKMAKCMEKDIKTWDDYAPIVRRSAYHTNEPPQNAPCGFIDSPPDYAGLAKQWVKSADRTSTTGKINRYQHAEEWMGCDAVLVDKNGIYTDKF